MKKLLSSVLCAVIIFSLFAIIPFNASAEEANTASVSSSSGETGDCTRVLDYIL